MILQAFGDISSLLNFLYVVVHSDSCVLSDTNPPVKLPFGGGRRIRRLLALGLPSYAF
jgi:hypothetical protein